MFDFPQANYTTQQNQGNRIIYLEGGTLKVFNEIIVSATGIYSGYTGGKYIPTVISLSNYKAEVILALPDNQQETSDSVPVPSLEPTPVDNEANDNGGAEEVESSGGTDNGGGFVTPMLLCLVMTVLN